MPISLKDISGFFNKGDARSVNAKKNILALIFLKGLNILTGFLIVPLTINYVSASSYGIWLALSSIIIWVSYFDFGLPNGFRNRFAEAKANGDIDLARRYVSTTYFVLTITFSAILCILLFLNEIINWSSLLNVEPSLCQELHDVFVILSIFFCIRVVASVLTFMLLADQKPALSAAVLTAGQLLSLITIYILTRTTSGSLTYLAWAIAGLPVFVMLLLSIVTYHTEAYKKYAPSFKCVQLDLTKNILGIGIQFFVITIIILLVLQVINVVISRELGPVCVTQYNLSYKYFSVVYMIMELIVSPFWSGFTEAYTQKDFLWMKATLGKLEKVILLSIPGIVLMIIGANFVIRLWVGDSISVPFSLHISMGIFVFFQSAHCVYANLVNGTGKAKLQLMAFSCFAIIAYPLIVSGIRIYGLWGCMLLPTLMFIALTMLCRTQIKKIINEKTSGLWNQ